MTSTTAPALLLEQAIGGVQPACRATADEAVRRWDRKTKPRGSLGRLERLATRYAAIRGTLDGTVRPAIVVAAGDHGVADEGVSAFPQAVTREMVANFARGGAAISVLARQLGAPLVVADCGVVGPPLADAAVRSCRIAERTGNIAREPAMSRRQALEAIAHGIELARELADEGVTALALGEMGIANTTSAAALAAVLTGADPELVSGPGTGLDADGVRRKADVVARALRARTPPTRRIRSPRSPRSADSRSRSSRASCWAPASGVSPCCSTASSAPARRSPPRASRPRSGSG